MSESWNVFDAPRSLPEMARREEAEAQRRQQERDLIRAVFRSPQGAEWLRTAMARVNAQPSYRPGDSFDQVAFAEGRKSVFREIEAALAAEERA